MADTGRWGQRLRKLVSEPRVQKAAKVGLKAVMASRPEGRAMLDLLDQRLPPGAIEELPLGRFPLSEETICQHVRKHLAMTADLQALTCSAAGIDLGLDVPRSGIRPALSYRGMLVIDRPTVSRSDQQMDVRTMDERLSGTSVLGWIAAPILQALLVRIYGGILAGAALRCRPEDVDVQPTEQGFRIGFGRVPVIQTLREPMYQGKSVFDLIEVTGCEHDVGRLLLQGRLPMVGARGDRTRAAED